MKYTLNTLTGKHVITIEASHLPIFERLNSDTEMGYFFINQYSDGSGKYQIRYMLNGMNKPRSILPLLGILPSTKRSYKHLLDFRLSRFININKRKIEPLTLDQWLDWCKSDVPFHTWHDRVIVNKGMVHKLPKIQQPTVSKNEQSLPVIIKAEHPQSSLFKHLTNNGVPHHMAIEYIAAKHPK